MAYENLANADIRQAIKEAGVKKWQVAMEYGVTDGNFSKLLRAPLPIDKRERVLDAIELAKDKYNPSDVLI